MSTNVRRKASQGFTLIELLVGLVLVLLLGALAASALTGQTDSTRQNSAQRFFIEDVPRAMTGYVSGVGAGVQITADANGKDDLADFGLSRETAWGDSWTITSAGTPFDGIQITYPIGGNTPDETGQRIADFLTQNDVDGNGPRFNFITNAQYANGDLVVDVTAL